MPVHIYLTMTIEKNIKDVINYLPFSLKSVLQHINKLPDNLQEIHLIAEKPLMLRTNAKRYFINESFIITEKCSENNITVSKSELEEVFKNICNYSVYSRQQEIINGFITLSGGNRAGICGTAVKKSGVIYNIRDISSINIRIAREVKDCSIILFENIKSLKSVLICGMPCSGKTTLLRDTARRLSYDHKVSLIDTRLELAACRGGISQFDVGFCDVFSGYDRKDGFEQALRCMSPDYIICDEIGADDVAVICSAEKSGVKVIASLHCADINELRSNPTYNRIIKGNVFSKYVFLDSRENAGQVLKIIDRDKLDD